MLTTYTDQEINKMVCVKPDMIELHLTNFCNHACSWCVADEIRKNNWHFSYENAEKLIRELGEMKLKTLIFSGGGDPFMFKGVEKLLELSHSFGIANNLITNGFGLNEKNIPIVAKTCELIRISIDAGNKETHNLIHRPKNNKQDNFDVITEKVSRLVKEVKDNNYEANVMLTFVVVDESYDSVSDFLELAEKLGVHSVDFKTNHFWSAKRKQEVYSKVLELVNGKERSFNISIEYPKSRVGEISEEIWSTFLISGIIEANGALYPCCHRSPEPNWYMGNVLESNFTEAWTGVTRKEIMKKVMNEHRSCPTCIDTNYTRAINKYVEKYGLEILYKKNELLSV